MELMELSEAIWRGEVPAGSTGPVNELAKLTQNVWFFNGFSNMAVVDTTQGLVVIDPGAMFHTPSDDGPLMADCQRKYRAVRNITEKPLNTVIYTHGHLDHIYGVKQYLSEEGQADRPGPKVVAHEAFPARVARYRLMSCQIKSVNGRAFRGKQPPDAVGFSEDFIYPNVLFRDELDLKIGNAHILIRHGKGETDDHAWVFLPEDRILCTGDFFIWTMPNAGNPQKVQRYSLEWAAALRRMAGLRPEILLPGHGLPILGQDRVLKALDDTATFLEHLNNQVLGLMNKGLPLEAVMESIEPPAGLINLPYLQQRYDETEFIVRNIWRLYGGWYDGVPSHLKPAPEKALADEVMSLIGDQDKVVQRIESHLADGDIRLATHLAEWACKAAPRDEPIRGLLKRVYQERSKKESSLMAKGIFLSAAEETDEPSGKGEI